jgi:hypothetical protein
MEFVEGCYGPIIDGKKNVKHPSSFYINIYIFYCSLKLILLESITGAYTIFLFAIAYLRSHSCTHDG